jgi:hypothetical protein
MWYMGASFTQHLTFSVHFSLSILSGIARHGYFGIFENDLQGLSCSRETPVLVVLALACHETMWHINNKF